MEPKTQTTKNGRLLYQLSGRFIEFFGRNSRIRTYDLCLPPVTESLPKAEVTVAWFHIVQAFTKRLDEVRKKERREQKNPKSLRWALLKSLKNEHHTPKQVAALQELVANQSATADAWVIKEKLSWIQKASTPRAARWRITSYLNIMKASVSGKPLLKPMKKALALGADKCAIRKNERSVSGGSFTRTGLAK